MTKVSSELKSVTALTSFRAVRIFDKGNEKHALIDQDSHVVGLIERDAPYYIAGSFTDALIAAERGLRIGAAYKAFACSPFGQHHYVLDEELELVDEFSDIPEVRKAQELANKALELREQIIKRKGTPIDALPNEKLVN